MKDCIRNMGGQHCASVGDSTSHHCAPWDFSVALEQAGQALGRDDERLALYWFNLELQKYAGTAGVEW